MADLHTAGFHKSTLPNFSMSGLPASLAFGSALICRLSLRESTPFRGAKGDDQAN
jgi:hypothetical protein